MSEGTTAADQSNYTVHFSQEDTSQPQGLLNLYVVHFQIFFSKSEIWILKEITSCKNAGTEF